MEEKKEHFTYTSEHLKINASEHRYEQVKKLLKKLPESERTVITLYYLGEMTTKSIGKFLGVSVTTITNRLQQAQRLLQDHELLLIQDVLGGTQISDSLTDNIMQRIRHIKTKPLSFTKRFLFLFL